MRCAVPSTQRAATCATEPGPKDPRGRHPPAAPALVVTEVSERDASEECRVALGQLDGSQIGRHHDCIGRHAGTQRVREKRDRGQHVDRNAAHRLQRRRMGIDHDEAMSPRSGHRVGDHARPDGVAGAAAAILTRVAEVRHDSSDPVRPGTPARVEHQQQLNDVVVHRWTRRLDDVHVVAADVRHRRPQLAVGVAFHLTRRRGARQGGGNRLTKRCVGGPGHHRQ